MKRDTYCTCTAFKVEMDKFCMLKFQLFALITVCKLDIHVSHMHILSVAQ